LLGWFSARRREQIAKEQVQDSRRKGNDPGFASAPSALIFVLPASFAADDRGDQSARRSNV
jgi:hypothetical protein